MVRDDVGESLADLQHFWAASDWNRHGFHHHLGIGQEREKAMTTKKEHQKMVMSTFNWSSPIIRIPQEWRFLTDKEIEDRTKGEKLQ